MQISIYTSGSTKEPKLVTHQSIEQHAQRAVKEIGLTSNDRVLNVFPANVIANFTVTTLPSIIAGSHLFTTSFEPFSYIKIFNEFQPTYISLIPRHYEILSKTKGWENFDMSCVRYMVTGSNKISQSMIDDFRARGVKTVANWYGMTEMPPPVFVGYNSETFDFTPREGYNVEFANDGECIINGFYTGDVFDVKNKIFLNRKNISNGHTWKT